MPLPHTAMVRAGIGLAQGVVLYLLYVTFDGKVWPATAPTLYAALLVTAIFVPLIAVEGYGNLRPRSFMIWTVAAAVFCAVLGAYDIYRDPLQANGDARLIPTAATWVAVAAGLFIAHSLVIAGEAEQRFVASYPRYFDVAWKHAVQVVLAVMFGGVFWGLIVLGAALFQLIHIDFFTTLIWQKWFWMPATTVSVTCAFHVTDASAGLVRGARTLKLTLLSWLLPMMTAIAVVFVLALTFTGLEPLWSTRRAASILLTATAALVLLINAAYHDGQPETRIAPVLLYARVIAAAVRIPLVALAGYAIWLRIQQHGWTPQRITALACFIVLACYALGYVAAAVSSGLAMRAVQVTNIAAAYLILAVLVTLFTPIADPARISVADQISRLESGRIEPDKFDYKFLRFGGGRYGIAALQQLGARTTGPGAEAIAQQAKNAMALKNPYQPTIVERPASTAESRAANITLVWPQGQSLPEDFLRQTFSGGARPFLVPGCLTTSLATAKCEAFLVDLDGDDQPEVLLFNAPIGAGSVFKREPEGWVLLGQLQNSFCRGVREALRAGAFAVAAPRFREIDVANNRLRIGNECAPAAPAPSPRPAPNR